MIFVLLPAYNEEQSLPQLLPKIASTLGGEGLPYRIVIGDDGSSDGTKALLHEYQRSLPLDIVEHKINRGLGETCRDLMEYAAEKSVDGDAFVRLDCDDTHEPEYIPFMLRKLDEGFDVVIASRFQRGGGQHGVGTYRRLVSACANLFMKVVFGIPNVRDFSCGFRAYRASIVKKAIASYGNNFIQLKGLGFTCTLEKLVKLHLLNARFAEIPFDLRYDQKVSESKMVSGITTLGYFVMALLYHWPWGGWRTADRKHRRSADSL
jgi:dolichol-phosphate mannosyltransferase